MHVYNLLIISHPTVLKNVKFAYCKVIQKFSTEKMNAHEL